MLTYKEIIGNIALKTGLKPNKVKEVLKSLNSIIEGEMALENQCRVFGLGTFIPAKSKKRIGRNPQTGENIRVPARFRVRFRPGKAIKSGLHYATVVDQLKAMATLMVSELLLYNSSEIDEGIRKNDLEERLKSQLRDARENFRKRTPDSISDADEIFETAWVHFIRKRTRAISAMS